MLVLILAFIFITYNLLSMTSSSPRKVNSPSVWRVLCKRFETASLVICFILYGIVAIIAVATANEMKSGTRTIVADISGLKVFSIIDLVLPLALFLAAYLTRKIVDFTVLIRTTKVHDEVL